MSSLRQQAAGQCRGMDFVLFSERLSFYVDLDAVVAEKNKSSYTMSTDESRQSLYLPRDKSAGQKDNINEMR